MLRDNDTDDDVLVLCKRVPTPATLVLGGMTSVVMTTAAPATAAAAAPATATGGFKSSC